MNKISGILVQPWNITNVTQFKSPKQEKAELWKQLIVSLKIHLTISIIPRFGHSGRSGARARHIAFVTGRPVLSGREQANNRVEATGQYF
jgi:hypothetical protein